MEISIEMIRMVSNHGIWVTGTQMQKSVSASKTNWLTNRQLDGETKDFMLTTDPMGFQCICISKDDSCIKTIEPYAILKWRLPLTKDDGLYELIYCSLFLKSINSELNDPYQFNSQTAHQFHYLKSLWAREIHIPLQQRMKKLYLFFIVIFLNVMFIIELVRARLF